MNLAGKTVLITGGRRVGRELAFDLAAQGAAIALTYHTSRATIEQAVAAIAAEGGRALAIEADLAQAEAADRAVAAVVDRFGTLDVLVSMASVYRRTPFAALVPDDFHAMVAANLAAPYFTAVAAARAMLRQAGEAGVQGKIVFVGDWATERPYRHYLPYLTAKGGLTTLTLALAKELAPTIPVNLVQPAMVAPPPDLDDAEQAAVVAHTPLRRIGTPGDVNRLIRYLIEGTDFATGACFRVDGGRFLGVDEL